ncbi:MAG: CvpA family protein [Thiovulaceae bacterium]|nr:CvpA family protein [Sulfurimonadaceae bacterium]
MIFDIIIIAIVIFAMYLGYKGGTSVELYRLGRVFLGMTLAGAYGTSFGWKLTHMGILAANSKAILTLVGFLLLFVLYWIITIILETLFLKFELHNSKLNNYLGMIANGIQALLIVTFISFISTQLTFTKNAYKAYLRDHSFSYIHMDRISRKVITANVVDEITSGGPGKIMAEEATK